MIFFEETKIVRVSVDVDGGGECAGGNAVRCTWKGFRGGFRWKDFADS